MWEKVNSYTLLWGCKLVQPLGNDPGGFSTKAKLRPASLEIDLL